MTEDELKAIEARARASYELNADRSFSVAIEPLSKLVADDVPALIAELRRLQESNDDMRNAAIERGERE